MAHRVELVLRTFLEIDIYDLRKFSTLFAGGAVNTQFKCIPVTSSSLPWPTSSLSALHIHCTLCVPGDCPHINTENYSLSQATKFPSF